MAQTIEDVKDEALRLIQAAQQEGILLRLLGGLAVKLRSPSASHRALERHYPDIDFVTNRQSSIRLPDFLIRMGYTPNKAFNTLNGDRRQLYYDLERDRQVDIFIGEFAMCHRIPFEERLSIHPITIPLAELFLTKAQIVELNQKDVLDLFALLWDHEVGPSDEGMINSQRVAELCAKDWGLYATVSQTMDTLEAQLELRELEAPAKELIRRRLTALRTAIEQAPKTTAWKLRARIGKKMRWYELPEEVRRG